MVMTPHKGEWRCFIRDSGEPYVMTVLAMKRQPLCVGKSL